MSANMLSTAIKLEIIKTIPTCCGVSGCTENAFPALKAAMHV